MTEISPHIPDHVDWKNFDVTVHIAYQDGTTETITGSAEGVKKSDAERYVEYNVGRLELVKNVEIISVEEAND